MNCLTVADFRETAASDVGIAMVVLLALSFIPSAFMVYLTNERVSQERHMQSISGVGTKLYWTVSFLWDMVGSLRYNPVC